MVEQGTHKPLVGSPNLPLGTRNGHKSPSEYGGLNLKETTIFFVWGSPKQEIIMSILKVQDQGIINRSQIDFLPMLIESFPVEGGNFLVFSLENKIN